MVKIESDQGNFLRRSGSNANQDIDIGDYELLCGGVTMADSGSDPLTYGTTIPLPSATEISYFGGLLSATSTWNGLGFLLDAAGTTGYIQGRIESAPDAIPFSFGMEGTNVGDAEFTDGTNTLFWDASANTLNLLDGGKLTLGTGGDGEIYVDASDDLYIDNATSNQDIYLRANDAGTMRNVFKVIGADVFNFTNNSFGLEIYSDYIQAGSGGRMCVGGNEFAFVYSALKTYGVVFNSAQTRYDFYNAGSPCAYIDVTTPAWIGPGLRIGTDDTSHTIDEASSGAGTATLFIGNHYIVASDENTGASAAAAGSVDVLINGTTYSLLYK